MTGIITSFLPPWLNPSLVGAALIGVGAAVAGGAVVHKLDQIPYSRLEASKAALQTEYSDYKARMAANSAQATSATLKEQNSLQALLNAAQAELAAQQRIDDAKSAQLKAILAASKPGDERPLGPTVLRFLDGLRNGPASPDPASP